ncbi:hypothetical protein Pmani_009814 [Petrolisthes manimaculis]|uniref:Uncharacterized protein n=1 Tax=Petrolisthes manimaculis TaxID=1843537 RepID=A0AAE1Q2Q8_9EUCA|nr:hypothetical protein Pmani_009814 [Petrolisthes manimaculis]
MKSHPVHSVAYNGINGIIYNSTILATGCFSARELWRLSKSSSGGGVNAIKMENPSYYTTYTTSPVPDHTSLMAGAYTTYMERADSPLSLGRGHEAHSPLEPRSKRVRRLSSEEDPLEKAELAYYTQSPAPLPTHPSTWHAELDHGPPPPVHSPHLVHSGGKVTIAASGAIPHSVVRTPSVESLSSHEPQHTRAVVSPQPREVLPPMSLSSTVMAAAAPSYYHEAAPPSPTKYHENGHDTFSDFVTLVCQEAQNTQHTQQGSPPGVARSPTKIQGGYYTTGSMLPPPPPPPMARPVAIIRSTADLAHSGSVSPGPPVSPPNPPSEPSSILPDVSPPDHRRDDGLSPPPPATSAPPPPQEGSLRLYITSRHDPHSHHHHHNHHQHQQGQLFTYSSMSPVSGAMSGVISPTSMSLFTSPGSTPRTTPRSTPPAVPRWNTPFINLDENMDYTTMSTLMPSLPPDAASAHLIEDERYFTTVVHTGDAGTGGPPGTGGNTGPPPTPLDNSPGPHPGAPHTPTKTQPS